MKRKIVLLPPALAVCGGLLAALAVCLADVPYVSVPAGFLCFAPYCFGLSLLFSEKPGKKKHLRGRTFLCGCLFGGTMALGGYHWLWYMLRADWLSLSKPVLFLLILAAHLLLTLLGGLWQGLSALLLGGFARRMKRGYTAVCLPLCTAGLWMLTEAVQEITRHGVPLFGIPWLRLSLAVTGAPVFLQAAALGGSLLVGGIMAVCGAWLGFGCRAKGKERKIALLCAFLLFAANAGAGELRLILPEVGEERTVSAAVVQGNLPSSDRWSEEGAVLAWERYRMLTQQNGNGEASPTGSGAELTVWTESAVPLTLDRSPELLRDLTDLSAVCDTTLVTGLFHRTEEGCYNSVYAFSPDGSVTKEPYSKRIPVPFGEYVPASSVLTAVFPMLAELNQTGTPFLPGTSSAPLETGIGKSGALVCFDAAYAYPAYETVRNGAEILLLLSNNAWFSDSAACRQAVGHAVLRAAENGRDLLCGASTGISAFIGRRGEILAESGTQETGVLYGDVTLRTNRTVFSRIGTYPLPAAVAVMLIFLYIFPVKRRKKRQNPSKTEKSADSGKKFQ